MTYPKAHRDYEKFLKDVLKDIPKETLDAPVEVRLMFVMPPYKTSSHPTHRADVDNLSKLPMDTMTKEGFWVDDNLVVSLLALKRFARPDEEPHTKVRVIPIEGSYDISVDTQFES